MAVTADKRAPVNKLSQERITDFGGGLNTTISGSLLNKNEAQVANDISYEQKGTVTPRKGRRSRYSATFSDLPCTGLTGFYKKDGTSRLVVTSSDKIYSDKPHIESKWTTKTDFEKSGTAKSIWVDTVSSPGNIIFKKSILGVTGDCELLPLWSLKDTVITLSDDKLFNSKAISIALDTGKTSGFLLAAKNTQFYIEASAYYSISAYVKNVDATSIQLVTLDGSYATLKSYTAVTGDDYMKVAIKVSPAEMAALSYVGLKVVGTAGQKALVDGVAIVKITESEYNDAGFVTPTYDEVELINKNVEVNLGLGTFTNMPVISMLVANVKDSDILKIEDVSVFATGTLSNISVGATQMSVNTGIPWSTHSAKTFDQLIAL